MKITVNQYAKSLYAATVDKSQKEIGEAVLNLTKILQKNRQLKLVPKIYKNLVKSGIKRKALWKRRLLAMKNYILNYVIR